MQKKAYKRRQYFVNKYFQGRLILVFAILASIGGFIAIALFNILAYRKIDTIMYSVHIPAGKLGDLLSADLIYANLFAFMFVLLILFIVINRLTSRVSGPLYRIKKDIEKLSEGDMSFNIILRYKDEFKDFASELNYMVDGLRKVFSSLKKDIEIINRYTRDIERYHTNPELMVIKKQQMLTQLESLENKLKELKL